MTVPYTFGTATTSIPLSNLDANFNTPITLGNTAIYLGNTTTTIGNLTLTNATISSGNVTVSNVTVSSITDSGNLTFTGTGNRITGDFSNATLASRVLFQSSTTNGATRLGVIPNGTSVGADFTVYNNADPTNASTGILRTGVSETQILSGITGTGTYLPLTMYTGGSERLRIDTSGNVGIGTSSPTNFGGGVTGLTINGSGGGGLVFKTAGSDTAYLYQNSTALQIQNVQATPITLWTSNTERMRIDSSGNVGIGSLATYEAKLKVATTNGSADLASSGINICGAGEITSGQVLPISFTPIGNDSTRARAAIACIVGANWGFGNLGFYTRGVADATVLTTADEKMRLDSSGNLLQNITTYPFGGSNRFVSKSATTTTQQIYAMCSANDSSTYIGNNGTVGVVGTTYGSTGSYLPLTFYTSDAERMRIDSSGSLLVGTTSAISGAKVTVNGQIATSPFVLINSSTATTIATGVSFMVVLRDRSNGGTALVLYENNTTPVIVSQTGVSFTTSVPTAVQIQIANLSGGGGITALTGSTIGTININVCVLQNQ